MVSTRLVIDPYFDGEVSQDARPSRTQAVAAGEAAPSSRVGYHPVTAEVLQTAGGRTMAEVMRPGVKGAQGVVIPRATVGGIPQGTRPHAVADLEVIIDPHISGQSTRIRLGDITAESVARATALAREMTPEPYNIESQRLRGAAELHLIAAGLAAAQEEKVARYQEESPVMDAVSFPPPTPPVASPPPLPPAHSQIAGAVAAAPRRRVSPLTAFNQPASSIPPQSVAADVTYTAAGAGGFVPQIHVYFELDGFGEMEAYYHDIVVEQGFLVLLFDKRFRGPKYFPPTVNTSEPPMMALNIAGTKEVYQVQTTGVHYEHNGCEHCVLMVDRVGQLPVA